MAGWTDYITGGSFKHRFSLTIEALRLAAQERYFVAYGTDFSSYAYLSATPTKGRLRESGFYTQFEYVMDLLLNHRFANHTVNEGNFGGLTEIPLWTRDSMLAYLGENRYYSNKLFSSNWAEQQYKILNLLRWRVPVASFGYKGGKQNITNDPWSTAKADFLADSWNDSPTYGPSQNYATSWSYYAHRPYNVSNDFYIQGSRTAAVINDQIYGGLKASYDIYIMPRTIPDDETWTRIFVPIGNADTLDVWNLVQSDTTEYGAGDDVRYQLFPDSESFSHPEPAEYEEYYFYAPPRNVYIANPTEWSYKAILKFDGANGFEFRDW